MNNGKREVNSDEVKESLARCRNIIFSINFEEFIKNLNNSISEQYSKEQCYKDIFKASIFSSNNIINFIKYIIELKNEEDIRILMNNLDLLDSYNLSSLVAELNEDNTWKEILNEYLKKGIIKSYNPTTRTLLLEILLSEEDGARLVVDRFEDFFVDGYDFKILNQIMQRAAIPEEKILLNKKKILENSYGENLILFIKWFKEKGIFNETDITLEDFIKQLYNYIKDIPTLKMLEICYEKFITKQNLSISDIEILVGGEYNRAYKLGEFILKLGETRETKTIPYHRRILQPLVRQETNPNNENNLYIEIQNLVDNKWYIGMTEEQIQEELYKIYKEMREDGIIWTDIKRTNVGRLIKPNKTNYYTDTLEGDINDEKTLKVVENELEVNDDSVGIIDRKQEELLKPGELVILDTDMIYKVEDINLEEEMEKKYPPRFITFEKRYRYELEQRKELR